MKSFCRAVLILTTLMLMVATASAQTYSDVYNFDGANGAIPIGALAQGQDGNLYGTTKYGGTNGDGVVFAVTPGGEGKALFNFDGLNGELVQSGLTLGTDGNFYGTTYQGGADNYGTIFKATPGGSLTTLYNFTFGADGEGPAAPPVRGIGGNYYGTTDWGTIYKITPSGSFTALGAIPGSSIIAPLLLATDGNFYGTTAYGGANNCGNPYYYCGTVFKMTPKGVMTTLFNFDGTNGQYLWAPVVQGGDGNLYGATYEGGSYGGGVIFQLTLQGAITVLHNFPDPNYPNDGSNTFAGLLQATDGNFYGVTENGGNWGWGVIFQITPVGGYSILHNFDGYKGQNPFTPPMQHTNGKIYGLAISGGTSQQGVVYSLNMGLGPFVSFVFPFAKVGARVEILGQGLVGTTGVSFNGTPANFTIVSNTYLTATVPSGATTGFVTVTTPGTSPTSGTLGGGILTSNKPFQVLP